ncbi:MAG: glycosyltransferase, partial [Rhodospirillaceae bacterium]|nr:glycosyltransferase [Rhodospirillaceae bacterium]
MPSHRVAHLIAPVTFGGGESVLATLLAERQEGIAEEVICLTKSPVFAGKLAEIGIAATDLTEIDIGHGVSKARMLGIYLSILWRLPRLVGLLRRHRIDLVHAHGFPAAALFPLVRLAMPRLRGVYTHHSHRRRPGLAARLLLGPCYRAYQARTAVSAAAARSMETGFRPFAGPFLAIHNCVAHRFFRANRPQEPRAGEERRVFIQVGRMIAIKNHDLVLAAVAELSPAERDGILIRFVGD